VWGDISFWFYFAISWWLVMVKIFSSTCWPFVSLLLEKFLLGSFAYFAIMLLVFLLLRNKWNLNKTQFPMKFQIGNLLFTSSISL
jgi:hypothetical protein